MSAANRLLSPGSASSRPSRCWPHVLGLRRPDGVQPHSPVEHAVGRDGRTSRPTLRVGLFGLLGSGNLGNDGSLEAVLAYLRARHPDAVLGCLCAGPEEVTARYGVPATPLYRVRPREKAVSGARALVAGVAEKLVDAITTLRWVRRFDVVLVPGMGVLEATVPLRPWEFPYALFLLSLAGRLTGTRIGLVCVGADTIRARGTRWLITSAARHAHYRSYRDDLSRDAMQAMGVDTASDPVYSDLAFALPTARSGPAAPTTIPGVPNTVYAQPDRRRDSGALGRRQQRAHRQRHRPNGRCRRAGLRRVAEGTRSAGSHSMDGRTSDQACVPQVRVEPHNGVLHASVAQKGEEPP